MFFYDIRSMEILLKFLLLATFLTNAAVNAWQSPYQVSIWVKPQSGNPSTHLCNGGIIQEGLILTTADCLHFRIAGSTAVHQYSPSMLQVLAGDIGQATAKIYRDVSSINIAPGFNTDTLEGDLAILKLNSSLPLTYRSDLKWIILDDYDNQNHTCVANFYSPLNPNPSSGLVQPFYVTDNWQCNKPNQYSRKNDLCSGYYLSPGVTCSLNSEELRQTKDRGTFLVCNNKLVGVLSQVIPPVSINNNLGNCGQVRRLNAYYTRVSIYLSWIYQQISAEKLNHSISPPYAGLPIPPNISSTGGPNANEGMPIPPNLAVPSQQVPLYPSKQDDNSGAGNQAPFYPNNPPALNPQQNNPNQGAPLYPNLQNQGVPLYPNNPNQGVPQHPNQGIPQQPNQNIPLYPNPNQGMPLQPPPNQGVPLHPNNQGVPLHPNQGVPLIHPNNQGVPLHPNQGVPLNATNSQGILLTNPQDLVPNPGAPLYPAPPTHGKKNGSTSSLVCQPAAVILLAVMTCITRFM